MPHARTGARTLTPQDVATIPQPGLVQPVNIEFSPDDSLITFLYSADHSRTRQLYAFDTVTGQRGLFLEPPAEGATDENVSLEEALRRERARQWGMGVTDYAWAKRGRRLLTPLPDGLYVQDEGGLRKVVDGPVSAPRFSPDSTQIAFVREGDVWIVDVEGSSARALTAGAAEAGVTRGLPEYIAAEEMDRHDGFWWSPDGTMIAFTEVDERHIPVYRIVHQGKDGVGEAAQEDHRYPFAGAQNAAVRLGVVDVTSGATVWMSVTAGGPQPGTYEYLARVKWLPSGELLAQLQDRTQHNLDLIRLDPHTGQGRLLLHQQTRVWINLHDIFHALPADHALWPGGFIWATEGTGSRHLVVHNGDGRPMRDLTEGEWMVDSLEGVDETRNLVYFTGTRLSALERHLCRVPLGGGAIEVLTPHERGTHSVKLDHACRRYVDVFESLTQPPRVTLRSLDDGSELAVVWENDDPRLAELGLQPPEPVVIRNRQGLPLHAVLYKPDSGRFGPGPYPTIVDVYGGPHVQRAAQAWRVTANMRAQHLAGLGFLVVTLDNRGSARRGVEFEAALRWRMGGPEVEDQVDGVRWLVKEGLTDPARVGVYGWSYGGYMALMCLAQAPETFHVAVAGAPVTHYDGYDTHYTERYMGLPQQNSEGYTASSVMAHVANIKGRLLLVHGLIDENVHFRHTARLINELIRHRVPYELMLFPDERHMPRRLEDREFMEERIRDFFVKNL